MSLKEQVGVIDFATNFESDSPPIEVELNMEFMEPFEDRLSVIQRIFDTKWKKRQRRKSYYDYLDRIKEMQKERAVIYSTKYEL